MYCSLVVPIPSSDASPLAMWKSSTSLALESPAAINDLRRAEETASDAVATELRGSGSGKSSVLFADGVGTAATA